MAQEAISLLVAEKAREGSLVARLKRGDPFVFDRGGEEALFLHENGIPFEVVPGIPRHRCSRLRGRAGDVSGGGDTITLVRGYEDESRTPPDIDWASLAKLEGTVVCYAGAQQLPRVLDAIQANGWDSDGQAVIVYNGTLTSQETVSGTIDELLERVRSILDAGRRFSSSAAWSAFAIISAGSTPGRCSANVCSSPGPAIRPPKWSID